MGRSQKRYDLDLLKEVIKRDTITVDLEKIEKISSLVRLDFICKCGKAGNKTFRLMFEKGSMCRECTIDLYNIRHKASLMENTGHSYALQSNKAKEKKKQTCIERFGVDNQMKCDAVKEKIKETCMERYGVTYCSQINEVKEKKKETCMEHYGVDNPLRSPEIKEKRKQLSLKRHGVESPSKLESVKEKVRQTNLKRYNVTYAIKLKFFKDKREATCLDRYGVTSVMKLQSVKEKRERTCMERYGVNSVMKAESVKHKSEETCLKKYGVRFISQSGLQIPNKFEFKKYTFPCGNVRFVQGYEPFALDDLVAEGYNYSDILTARSDVPSIWYTGDDGKRHRYFVDIYIPKSNKMIEVKSKWTYIKYYETVILKAKECLFQGYIYEIWIYDYKRNKTII